MSKNWKPAQNELATRLENVTLDEYGDGTKAAASRVKHEGPKVNPLVPPIHTSSTYIIGSVDEYLDILQNSGYLYLRLGNPNLSAVECAISAIEGGAGSLAFTSGMAAITTALTAFLRPGDHVVCCNPVYSGTHKFLSKYLTHFNVEHTFVPSDGGVEVYRKAVKPNTKMLFGETPCNPTMAILDMAEFAELGRSIPNCITIVDSTFGSPYLQKPCKLGIDISMHSATKYLGGHSDLVAGVLTVRTEEMWQELNVYRTTLGNCLSPFDASLLLRGVKSLHVRMERHCSNAHRLALFLQNHPKVGCVFYPGHSSHPGHEVAKKQMSNFGGMISFEVKGGLEGARKFIESVRVINLAVSLGGVESLMQHPATMSHGPMVMSDQERKEAFITDGLIRFSVGIEDVEDLEKDLKQALDKVVVPTDEL